MTDVVFSKTNGFAVSFLYRTQSCLWSKTVVSDNDAAEVRSESLANFLNLIFRLDRMKLSGSVSVLVRRFRKFHKANLPLTELPKQVSVCLHRILIKHVLNSRSGRQLDAHLMGLEMFECDIDELKCQASPVFCTASIAIGSLIGEGPEELVYYIAESPMELNSVESCLFGKDEGSLELPLYGLDVLQGHLLGRWVISISQCSNLLPILDGRWRPRLQPTREGWMGDSACMESLKEDDSSLLMHPLNDLLPTLSLLFIPKSALARIPISSLRDGCSLSENEASSSPLGIVLHNQISGNTIHSASNPCQCAKNHSVFNCQLSKLNSVRP